MGQSDSHGGTVCGSGCVGCFAGSRLGFALPQALSEPVVLKPVFGDVNGDGVQDIVLVHANVLQWFVVSWLLASCHGRAGGSVWAS